MKISSENEQKKDTDKVAYQDPNIVFMMEGESVYVGNIVYEKFARSIPMHAHSDNSYEIHYIPEGRGRVTVSGTEYELCPGTLYITGPHVQHSMIPDKKDRPCEYCIYLKLSDALGKDKKTGSPLRLFRETDNWYGRDRYGIPALMKALFAELRDKNIGYRAVVESLIKQIIIACVRNSSAEKNDPDRQSARSDESQYLAIEEAFLYEYATITLESLAKRLNLSTRQVQRLLIRHYGMNFQNKKTEAKMSAASIMLRSGDMSVTQIADELGYSSVEHFSAAFRKYFGMSATVYRRDC